MALCKSNSITFCKASPEETMQLNPLYYEDIYLSIHQQEQQNSAILLQEKYSRILLTKIVTETILNLNIHMNYRNHIQWSIHKFIIKTVLFPNIHFKLTQLLQQRNLLLNFTIQVNQKVAIEGVIQSRGLKFILLPQHFKIQCQLIVRLEFESFVNQILISISLCYEYYIISITPSWNVCIATIKLILTCIPDLNDIIFIFTIRIIIKQFLINHFILGRFYQEAKYHQYGGYFQLFEQ
ncbi:unnamed protein product [Paramecium octaurelia]|uniref:Uncharacterized protein n=1 Tax=Paramecium octaurelia TaxID=43137 RepID=A0A8S1Y5I5_PAROT|nr:unnamed protein product [Paramecium octaurelia]